MKIQDYVKRKVKKCIICIMLITALFLPAIRNNIISVFAEEETEEGTQETSSYNYDTDSIGDRIEERYNVDIMGVDGPEKINYDKINEDGTPKPIDGKTPELDYVEVELEQVNAETHYYVTDAEGKPIAVEENGNQVMLEVSEGTTAEKVYVVEKEEPAVPVTTPEAGDNGEIASQEDGNSTGSNEIVVSGSKYEVIDKEKIKYGSIEDGVFRELPAQYLETDSNGNVIGVVGWLDTDKFHAFVFMEDGSYKETNELNKMVIKDGEGNKKSEIFVDDGAREVITDLQKLADGTFLENPMPTPTGETEKPSDGTTDYYSEWKNELDRIQDKAKEKGLGVKVTCSVTVAKDGESEKKTFDPTKVVSGVSMDKSGQITFNVKGNDAEGFYIEIASDRKDENGNPVPERIPVDSGEITVETVYKVVDGIYEDGNKVLCEIDATTKARIDEGHFVRVNDNMYKVKDKDNKDVYFTADEWKIVTGTHTVYKEITKYYYTSELKYAVVNPSEDTTQTITLEDGNKSGTLEVKFWENDKIERLGAWTWEITEDGKIKIRVPYKYKDSTGAWKESAYEETKSFDEWFEGKSKAIFSIKYTPKTITTTTETTEFTSTGNDKVNILPDGTIEVIENGGEPINSKDKVTQMGTKDSQPAKLAHVDVRTEGLVNKQIAGQNVSAHVSGVSVSINGNPVDMFTKVATDNNRGDGEYITCKRGQTNINFHYFDGYGNSKPGQPEDAKDVYPGCMADPLVPSSEIPADGEVLITIQATITYTITENGEEVTKTFLYTVNLYPEPSNAWNSNSSGPMDGSITINECKWWDNDGGFDYTIKANAIEELVRQNIKTTYEQQLSVELEHPEPSPNPTTSPEPTPTTTPEPTPTTTPEPTPTTTPEPTPTTVPEPTPTTTPEQTPGTTPAPEVTPTPGTPEPTPEVTPGTTPAPEVTPTPGTTPAPEPEPTPEETPGPTPVVTSTPVPTTPDEPPTTPPTVLGARRVQMDIKDASVLGARRGLETAVLGKRRRPTTGDSVALFLWIIALSVAMGGAISSVIMLEAERDKKNRKMS